MPRQDPVWWISHLQAELDRLFQETVQLLDANLGGSDWQPALDVMETPTSVVFLVEVPGLSAADLEVEVRGEVVTLKGTKITSPQVSRAPRFHCLERHQGRFLRQVRLLWPVNSHHGRARLKQGLLTIEFPKVEEQRQDSRRLVVVEEDEGASDD